MGSNIDDFVNPSKKKEGGGAEGDSDKPALSEGDIQRLDIIAQRSAELMGWLYENEPDSELRHRLLDECEYNIVRARARTLDIPYPSVDRTPIIMALSRGDLSGETEERAEDLSHLLRSYKWPLPWYERNFGSVTETDRQRIRELIIQFYETCKSRDLSRLKELLKQGAHESDWIFGYEEGHRWRNIDEPTYSHIFSSPNYRIGKLDLDHLILKPRFDHKVVYINDPKDIAMFPLGPGEDEDETDIALMYAVYRDPDGWHLRRK